MFYSHEVLTSRKYGVATVWLVATLGAKSSLKRINRKQILDVDVEKACQSIIDPVVPMALRLQGNLLYGVSRVYMQQCGYVLSDAQNAHTAIRMLLRTEKDTALDPDAGKARPEQLVLPDDPSFLPDFALPLPDLLADLDIDIGFRVDDSQLQGFHSLTPFGSQRSDSSHAGPIGGLVLPSSSPNGPADFRLEGDNDPANVDRLDEMLAAMEPDFTFGDDGDIIDLDVRKPSPRTPGVMGRVPVQSDTGVSSRVRKEHEEGRDARAQFPIDNMDIDFPVYGDDLPEGETFSQAGPVLASEQLDFTQSTSQASAPVRQKRRAPVLPHDTTLELGNRDLAEWNKNYLENMKAAAQTKNKAYIARQAKKNAEYLVWGAGIGGIGTKLPAAITSHPLSRFVGDDLFEMVTGTSRIKPATSKHDRDSGIDEATQDESRKKRLRSGEPEDQVGREADDDGFFLPDDDEVELPREAVSALNDEQMFSAMPWNISASIRGSSAVPRSGRVVGVGSVDHSKRGSRMVSASPLLGRGLPASLEALHNLESDAGFAGDDIQLPEPSSDYPQPLLPDSPPTNTRVQEALSAEGDNFLTFVVDGITEKSNRMQAELDDGLQIDEIEDIDSITLEELLPPLQNTKMIACQGLMMVLALGSKGVLDVRQPEHFGEIRLKLTHETKAAQMEEEVIEISDGMESSDDEMSDSDHAAGELGGDVEGQSQERVVAGIASRAGDDHDSLYDD